MALPNLQNVKIVAIDTETYDPNLKEFGCGGLKRDGFVVCVTLTWMEGKELKHHYIPIGHEDKSLNLEHDMVLSWMRINLAGKHLVMANALYDMEWLYNFGFNILNHGCTVEDIQVNEFLIDDNRPSYSMEALANIYLPDSPKLTERLLDTWVSHGNKRNKDLMYKGLAKFSVEELAPYALADTDITYRIFEMQQEPLKNLGLNEAHKLECKVLLAAFAMRLKGIRIDKPYAEALAANMMKQSVEDIFELCDMAGVTELEIWNAESIARASRRLGLPFPVTGKKKAPSFTAAFMEQHSHPFFKLLHKVRQNDRAGAVYVKNKIVDLEYNGRLYYHLHTAKSDRGGAVSGRLSSSNPNVMQIPSDSKVVRRCFLPEEGERWVCFDENQAEPRIILDYAFKTNQPGALEAVQAYLNNPNTDYHSYVASLLPSDLPIFQGLGFPKIRFIAKVVNLMLAYGAGVDKTCAELNVGRAEGEMILETYHKNLPYMKKLSKLAKDIADSRGFIRTISGRRRTFNLWGPSYYTEGDGKPLPFEEARLKWADKRIVRYFTYKSLNALVQGTAADIHKMCLVNLYEAGYIPLVPVHDEVDFSIPLGEGGDKQIKEIQGILLDVIKLSVQRRIDVEQGPTWGDLA